MIPRVLTIAASDSSGAAGLQADLKTFEARQVYGLTAVTAITAQDSKHIEHVQVLDPDFVAEQIAVVLNDVRVDAIKTGLLFQADILSAMLDAIKSAKSVPEKLIVDPVLVTGDGRCLVDDTAIAAYITDLFPHAWVITPNLHEAALLTDVKISSIDDMYEAAQILHAMGPAYVVIKGGHLGWGDKMFDILYDGDTYREYRSVRLPIRNPRGAGCTFASCIAAEVAKGRDVPAAVEITKRYVTTALTAAAGWQTSRSRGMLFHSTGRPPLFNDPKPDN